MAQSTLDLHLFSTPGPRESLEWVVDACRTYLQKKPEPVVAHIPFASLYAERSLEQVRQAFQGLAKIETLDPEFMQADEMEAILRRAAVAFIPGGNTFLLNHRLHTTGIVEYLRKKLQAGLPLIGVSAGTVICGPNILTSNDINMVPTTHFDGLKLCPFSLVVHYDEDPRHDDRLVDYRAFHDIPLLLLGDGAHLHLHGRKTRLVRGPAWIWRPNRERERLGEGQDIPFAEE